MITTKSWLSFEAVNIYESYRVIVVNRVANRNDKVLAIYYLAADEDGTYVIFDNKPKFNAYNADPESTPLAIETLDSNDWWECYQDDDGNDSEDGEINWDGFNDSIDDSIITHYRAHRRRKLDKDAYKDINELDLFPMEEVPHEQTQGR
jgi:hypothetical protein